MEQNYDLTKGHFVTKTIHIEAQEEQQEEGHYETVAEYPNGGKDVKWVIDKPYIAPVEEQDKEIQEYVLYTENELKIEEYKNQLQDKKQQLANTDYKAIKYIEGWYTEEEYEPIKQEREIIRETIRNLQDEIENLKTTEKYKNAEDI